MPHFTAQSQQDPSLPLSLFPHPFCTHSYLKCLFCSVPLLVVLTSNLIRYQRSLFDFFFLFLFCFAVVLVHLWCGGHLSKILRSLWVVFVVVFFFFIFIFFLFPREKERTEINAFHSKTVLVFSFPYNESERSLS